MARARKPKVKKVKHEIEKLLKNIVITPEGILKIVAVGAGTAAMYYVLDNKKIAETYSDIQLAASPILFALKKLDIFNPYAVAAKGVNWGFPQKLAFSFLGSYVLVEHGDDILGLMKGVI